MKVMAKFQGHKSDAWRILCRKCGKFKAPHFYVDIKRKRICSDCTEETVEVSAELIRHVQSIFGQQGK